MSCADPISFARLVDYWAGELDAAEVDRVDEHLLACASCSGESMSVSRLVGALRGSIPPIVSAEQARELAARGLVVVTNDFVPDERKEVLFERGVDVLLHRLGGLALGDVQRVGVVVRGGPALDVMMHDDFVPFDRERGEVLVACQRHFAGMPAEVVFEVQAHHASGDVTRARFVVPHVFEGWP